ncbi:MAG TPA: DUF4190 domain-containing protein [Candidatus Dormibacteraeota bacterium]|nr:DUF4190 domain-containing protein [Candidatus Dormibacteraeota bacterium]
MSTPPSDLPGPPPAQPSGTPTQIAGQQVEPSSTVPVGPAGLIGPAFATGRATNTLAVVSIATAIGSFFAHIIPGIGGFTVALIAVITGYMARRQIRQTGEQGMGLATAGMVIGIIHLALIVLAVIGIVFMIFVLGIALFGNVKG